MNQMDKLTEATINGIVDEINPLNIDKDEFISKLDPRVARDYEINQELYDDFGDINMVNKNNNKLAIYLYRDVDTNKINVSIGATGTRQFVDSEEQAIEFINNELNKYYEEQAKLNEEMGISEDDEWDKEAERLEKVYKKAYDEYVKANPENHLDYVEWSDHLPMSYRDELNKLAK